MTLTCTLGAVKRSAAEHVDDEKPPKKIKSESVIEENPASAAQSLEALSNSAQVDALLVQVNREILMIEKHIRLKEDEWNILLRNLKEKEELAVRLKRRNQVLRFQAGESDLQISSVRDNTSSRDPSGGGLLAALTSHTSAQSPSSFDSNPLAMMSRLLSNSMKSQVSYLSYK